MKLLLVEDEKIILNGILRHVSWEELGISDLRAASSADEALTIFSVFHPDIVLTDIRMPGMTGLAMVRRMREQNPELPVILMTGFSDREYLKSAIDIGVISFLEKPIEPEELRRAIRKAVAVASAKSPEVDKPQAPRSPQIPEAPKAETWHEESEKTDVIIESVKAYIEAHFADPELRLSEVADAVFLTPTYLSSLFKKNVGTTIGQFITDRRIAEAKQLLLDPRYKFYDIAERIGYRDENYFARTFRKNTGMTPSEYRRKSG